jgi:hypothetical protein
MEQKAKILGNEPAMAFIEWVENGLAAQQSGVIPSNSYMGLTKREHFAGLAMQGLLASTIFEIDPTSPTNSTVKIAVQIADLLLEELAKEQTT